RRAKSAGCSWVWVRRSACKRAKQTCLPGAWSMSTPFVWVAPACRRASQRQLRVLQAALVRFHHRPSACVRWRSLLQAGSGVDGLLSFERREPDPIAAHAVPVFEQHGHKLPGGVIRCHHAQRIRVAAGDDLLVREIEEGVTAVTDTKGRIHDQGTPSQRLITCLGYRPEDG